MYNNVVGGVQGALVQEGYSTLRFNFRGVGGSGGEYGEGEGEVEDVRGAAGLHIQEIFGVELEKVSVEDIYSILGNRAQELADS